MSKRWSALLNSMVAVMATAVALGANGTWASGRDELRPRVERALQSGDFREAAGLIAPHLQRWPYDDRMLYQASRAWSRLGDSDRAASYLQDAVLNGFLDFRRMQEDPCLEPLHDHPTFQAIVEASDQLLEQRGPGVLAQWKDRYGETSYRYEKDSVHRLVYATALDDASHLEMRQMLERQADHLIDAYFSAPPAYYVLIAVPTPEDAQALFDRKDQIGGVYEHSLRRLVARDIGSSLRHEFFHLMHFGHMVRLQQAHPVWIHEGLASLYEDFELSDTGDIRFIPNDRHNTAHALARQGKLTPWSELFASSQPQFMKQAAASYAQARSIFRYVAEQGLLEEWYRIYTTQEFKIDPTGASALEIVFQRQLNGIEKNWQAWLEKQDDVDVAVDFGDTGLGIQSEFRGSNDGVLVTGVVPKSSAHRAQLQPGDVVVAVNDEPTRSFLELRRLIGTLKVGYWVEIRLRRGETYLTVPLKIQPLPKK